MGVGQLATSHVAAQSTPPPHSPFVVQDLSLLGGATHLEGSEISQEMASQMCLELCLGASKSIQIGNKN